MQSILDEAKAIIYNDREGTYGDPERNLRDIAGHWSIILKTKVTTDEVCLCMIALKLARLSYDPTHHDSQVDTCGYTGLLERIQKSRQEPPK